LIIGATNRPQDIDPLALRPGRFDNKILIPLPDKKARKHIFYLNLHHRFADKIDYPILAYETEGYSGADIAGICAETSDNFSLLLMIAIWHTK
jgi:transitional endoplasmic reticulum ATPase